MTSQAEQIVADENGMFAPPPAFRKNAHIGSLDEYKKMYQQSVDHPETFWGQIAKELHWFKPWTQVLEWKPPHAQWFLGGKTNLSYNCLDRHLDSPRAEKRAIIWEGEPGDVRTFTYAELHREVCKFAGVLRRLGVQEGDRVCIYMPLVPELAIALLACARIGAPHGVIFGGFSARALVDRITDAQAKMVITADGGWRRGKVVPLKAAVDEALEECPSVEQVVVLKRTENEVQMRSGRDSWWHELIQDAPADTPAAELDSEHPLFILYTSGTTGKPKGIVHTTGGYMVGTYLSTKYVFDLKDDDVYWCTADIGWITGHSYTIYGPLANGATVLMYEGAPHCPAPDRFWKIIEDHRVTIFYTAPTAIRACIKCGDEHPAKHDLSSLRLLGTVGEPINPEAWMWYHKVIGGGRCPIVDTWWQTETGSIMITSLPGAIPTKPGSASLPFFGVSADVVDADGNSVPPGENGLLVLDKPWPAMLRTLYRDDERYREMYWTKFKDRYFTGDGATRDADGYFRITGRVDDVINVSGHRLGTAEIESALVSHESVAEAAVVGFPHEIKGQGIAAFVTLRASFESNDPLKATLKEHVKKEIGGIARPDQIHFTDALPKTRSGKIMRRMLREIASGRKPMGDTSTLEDHSVLAKLLEP